MSDKTTEPVAYGLPELRPEASLWDAIFAWEADKENRVTLADRIRYEVRRMQIQYAAAPSPQREK